MGSGIKNKNVMNHVRNTLKEKVKLFEDEKVNSKPQLIKRSSSMGPYADESNSKSSLSPEPEDMKQITKEKLLGESNIKNIDDS